MKKAETAAAAGAATIRDESVYLAICCAGWQQEGVGPLHISDAAALKKVSAAAAAAGGGRGAKEAKGAGDTSSFPSPPALAVHRVRWSRSGNGDSKEDGRGGGGGGSGMWGGGSGRNSSENGGRWLAHGGAAGLVCIQPLP